MVKGQTPNIFINNRIGGAGNFVFYIEAAGYSLGKGRLARP